MRLRVRSLALLSGLRIWHCLEPCCSLQMWLGSRVAVAVVWAGSYSSDWTPSLGTSICLGCGPKKTKKKKKKRWVKKCIVCIIQTYFVIISTLAAHWNYLENFFLFGCLVAYGVPGPGIRSEIQLWLMPQPSQQRILNLLCWAGDWTCVPVLQRPCWFCCTTAGTVENFKTWISDSENLSFLWGAAWASGI